MVAALLTFWLLTQVPCSPAENTAVCQCKQGVASACEAIEAIDPQKAAQLQRARRASQAEGQATAAKAEGQSAQAAGQAARAAGQQHHAISQRIHRALEEHPTLKGHYQARDPRFVTQAKDLPSHKGYQEWHRKIEDEVIAWLKQQQQVSPAQFEKFLRELYSRPDLLGRFPGGL